MIRVSSIASIDMTYTRAADAITQFLAREGRR